MDVVSKKKAATNKIKKLRELIKEKGISPSEMLTDSAQGDSESQPSDEEVEVDEDKTLETFIRTVPETSKATKLTLSPTVPGLLPHTFPQ